MKQCFSQRNLVVTLGLGLFLSLACGKTQSSEVNQSQLKGGVGCSVPSISYLFLSQDTINAGESVTINYGFVAGASAVYLRYPDGHQEGLGTPGTKVVKPTVTSTYTLVIYDSCGAPTLQIPLIIYVNNIVISTCSGKPQFNKFIATPSVIHPGETVTLSWNVTNADALLLTHGTRVLPFPPGEGSKVVRPQQSTTWTLRAFCQGATKKKSVNITYVADQGTIGLVQVNSININGGLSTGSSVYLDIRYNVPMHAVLQAVINGQFQSNPTHAVPGADAGHSDKLGHVKVEGIGPGQVENIEVCLYGSNDGGKTSNGVELACLSK